ncbi:hypothetical protein L596_023107 [Steinernema carpocapsae]|uniref:BTB domain-containing protein n=1 Tax=Steinernema carpocapsae TaxID=34508 RepID=A0A4U5MCN1_STECR|nr:hypothetical protein L596_023107 [Steinernema carpocapsae]
MVKNRACFEIAFEAENLLEDNENDDNELRTEPQTICGLNFRLCLYRSGGDISIENEIEDWNYYLVWKQSVSHLEVTLNGVPYFKSRREQTSNGYPEEPYTFEDIKKGLVEVKCDYEITRLSMFKIDEFQQGFADVKLQVKERRFFVSKLFLSAHSPAFAAMLNSESESKEQTLQLEDVDYGAFYLLLHRFYGLPLVYAGRRLNSFRIHYICIADIEPQIKSVLKLAYRYQFQVVLFEIEDYLLTLNDDEAKEWFGDADSCQLTRLTSKIISNMDGDELKSLYKEALQSEHRAITKAFAPETVEAMFARIMDLQSNS